MPGGLASSDILFLGAHAGVGYGIGGLSTADVVPHRLLTPWVWARLSFPEKLSHRMELTEPKALSSPTNSCHTVLSTIIC